MLFVNPVESAACGQAIQFKRVDAGLMDNRIGPAAARVIAALITGNDAELSTDEKETAELYRGWHRNNKRLYAARRRLRH